MGGGEVWEEVDLSNWPTNWTAGDVIKISTRLTVNSIGEYYDYDTWSPFVELGFKEIEEFL